MPTALNNEKMIWPEDGKEMVRVPAGVFLYGDDLRKVDLPEFWIDKTLVTNAEYARFMADTGYKPKRYWAENAPQEAAAHPVTCVNWYDAVAYANWAEKRLPTEQEWEKAARGTDGQAYPWGDQEPTPELCNFGRHVGGPTPVGLYSPQGDSPCGCVDMAGNVWEWTASDYDGDTKVLRGGSWLSYPGDARCACRFRLDPYGWYGDIWGFRCVVGATSSL